MTRRLLALFLSLSIFLVPFAAKAATESPTSLGPPEHFGVGYYYTDSVYLTMSAPEDVRAYMQKKTEEHPDNYPGFSLHFQLDYKIDGGAWHHTSEWDSPKTAPQVQQREFRCDFTYGKSYVSSGRWGLSGFFPDDEALKLYNEKGWEYLESHSITFRSRFVESFDKGNSYVISPWSKEFTLSANKKADYNKLINHAPTLLTGEVKKRGVEPYFEIKTDRIPGEIQDLNAISGNSIITEVWARMAGESEFKMLDTIEGFNEVIDLTASDFSAVNKDTFEGAGYEIKARYALDLRKYKQSGVESTTAVYIYSPFSNIISHNMPSWSKASAWATVELKKADDLELIPSILKGADMTKSITRKEFAAVSLKLYEKLSGKTVIPTVTNPFKDTNDQEVLKAYQVGITAGVAIDKFAPDDLLNREQAATMLTRVFKKSFVQGWTLEIDSKFDFNYTMPSKFTDDAKISNWAKPSVYFMVTHGIISGVGANNFAPRAITSAEQAANYASATREQALAISVRMTEKLDSTDAKEIIPLEQKPTEPTQPAEPTKPFEKQAGVSGVYMGFINTWAVTGYYTPRPYWLVLFDDGTFYYDLPSEGLDNFDKNNSNALTNENCGVYK
ncbi:MAG: S-layer homology domain-containing protein, partial [Tissierellales bacterium]